MEVANNVLDISDLDRQLGLAHDADILAAPRYKDKLDTLRVSVLRVHM